MQPHKRRSAAGGGRWAGAATILAALAWLAAPAAAQPAPRVYRGHVEAHWSADGGRFWYRNDLPGGGREFVLVDAAAGTREPAFDPARVADALARATGRPSAGDRLPVDALEFGPARADLVLVAADGKRWQLDRHTYDLKPAATGPADAGATRATDDSNGRGDRARRLASARPSRPNGAESRITFLNRAGGPVDLYWVDPDGGRLRYATVPDGERHEQHTFAGHVWVAVDRGGRDVAAFEATDRPTTATIDRSTRDDATDGVRGERPNPPATRPATQPARPVSPSVGPQTAPLVDASDAESADLGPATEDAPFALTSNDDDDSGGPGGVAPQDAAATRPRRSGQGRRGGRADGDGWRDGASARGPVSPDRKWVLSARGENLYVRPRGDGGNGGDADAKPLTSDGRPGDGYALDRVWWSPDGSHLVALRTEAAQEHKVYTVESLPKDQVQPKLRTLDYLKPGDKVEHPRPRLFRVADRTWVPVSDELFANPWSLRDVRWSADSSRFTFVYNQRGHQALRVVAVDAATGRASAVVDETSPTFIDYSGKFFLRWLGDDELLWMSERDGWNHLYLYDAKAGRVKNQVTRGPWVVQAVERVDPIKRQVYFKAGGVRPGQDPYYTHYCRANFDGSGLTVLTEGDGTHAVEWSPDGRYLIDNWSRVDLPPVTELRRGDDGSLVCRLEVADASAALSARGGRWPMPLAAKGRDGETDVFGVVWLPRDFDPAKTYPVLENVYAGPQGFFTPKKFSAGYGERQRLADRGLIVVQADGMGTSGRSRAFHDVCFKNLKDAGFADRIAWIKAAAAGPVPQMDLSRVGIYGGSAGGQNAMAALIWHHDFYKVAVADCGCHDNRMDKIWWNEQWMGWPVDASYAASSNVVHAGEMRGKLMLVVGELDDNVDPSSTFQTAAALQRAGKDFELVVVAGAKHGAAETPYGNRKRGDFLTRNLLGKDDD